jgi:hypothetical protein
MPASYMCPPTTVCLPLICVLRLLYACLLCVSSDYCMRPHTTTYVSSDYYICVLILLYMCPHTTVCVLRLLHVSSYYYTCVLILLYVSSDYYICVLILLYMCPHTTVCVLILLHMCPHTAIHNASSCYTYMCPHTVCSRYRTNAALFFFPERKASERSRATRLLCHCQLLLKASYTSCLRPQGDARPRGHILSNERSLFFFSERKASERSRATRGLVDTHTHATICMCQPFFFFLRGKQASARGRREASWTHILTLPFVCVFRLLLHKRLPSLHYMSHMLHRCAPAIDRLVDTQPRRLVDYGALKKNRR